MRKIFYFIIFTVLMLSAGCSHDNQALLEAERLMDEDYTEALRILDSIPEETLTNKRDRALYGLLLTQAQEKNHLDPANDSLITAAADYFADKNDLRHQTIATYYQGVVRQRNGCQSEALLSFLKAKDLAEEQANHFWVGMSCRGIADINRDNYNYADASGFYQHALDNMRLSGVQPYIDYAIHDLAYAQLSNRNYDSSLKLCQEVADSATSHGDDYLLAMSRHVKAGNLLRMHKIKEAGDIIKSIFESGFASDLDTINYCQVLISSGQFSEASELMDRISSSDQARIAMLRARLAASSGDYKTAYLLNERTDTLVGEMIARAADQNLMSSAEELHSMQLRLERSEIKNSRYRFSAIILGILIIGATVFLLIRKRNRKKLLYAEAQASLGRMLMEAAGSQSQLNELEKQRLAQEKDTLDSEKKRIKGRQSDLDRGMRELLVRENHLDKIQEDLYLLERQIQTKRYDLLNELSGLSLKIPNQNKLNAAILRHVNSMISDIKNSPAKIVQFEEEVNHSFNGLMSNLKEDIPGLKEHYRRFYLFCVLGFSYPAIAVFMNKSVQQLYYLKKGLKDKLSGLPEGKRSLYLSFMDTEK